MLSDDLKCFSFSCKNAWNFACRFQLDSKMSLCIIFRWPALNFRDITYANNPQFFKRHLLEIYCLERKTKETPFVSLKDEVTIIQ